MSLLRLLTPILLLGPPLAAQPRIAAPSPEFDFGQQRSGAVVEHRFRIENRGDKVLKIHRVRASCGCTVPELERRELRPGESGEVGVRLDLAGRSGPQRQHITLSTNDPAHPSFTLSVLGEAVPGILIHPRTLNLGLFEPGESPSGTIELRSTTGTPFEIRRLTPNNRRVEARVETAEDGLSARIAVTPLPQSGQGHFTDILLLETSDPDLASVRILVMWQISSGVSVSPAVLSLVLSDSPTPTSRFFMVKGSPKLPQPLAVTGAEWPGREIPFEITDTGEFGWRVEVRDLVPAPEMHREQILLHTNAPGFETLKIPVRVLHP